MAIKDSPLEMQSISSESEGSNTDSDWDDSEGDPDYDMLEETYSNFSNLSLKNKAKSRVVEGKGKDPEVLEMTAPSLPEENFEKVKKMIKDGMLEKLKVDECKLYLRNNGLRLTGNKDTLIQRIREHLEIANGGGERKYPPSSFVLNCKGDACTGDVVLFEQNVYEMFNIASRSASGPPCGKRIVAGRIVKESYGAAKQQHTFTIEVLWSKGEKPFPPLHPLLIKGRNLYRLKTLRQKWEDEGERQKILMEKHSRGFVAREDREARMQEKERRKTLRENRVSKKDSVRNRCQPHSHTTISQYQPQETNISIIPEKPTFPYQNSRVAITERFGKSVDSERVAMGYIDSGKTSFPVRHIHNRHQQAWKRSADFRSTFAHDQFSRAELSASYNWPDFHCRENPTIIEKYYPHHFTPLMPNRESFKQKQPCKHYARGRCYFGDNCKFLHDLRENVYKGNA